jgi:hypothetical protein
MATLRTQQEVRKLKQEIKSYENLTGRLSALEYCNPNWNIVNSLKGFASEFFKLANVIRKIAIKLGTQKRKA